MKSTVPQSMWGDILDELDLADQPELAESDEHQQDNEAFEPDGCDDEY
ncbi:hypothetical protein OG921_12955 [Aldersonia sp. NBC_00410]|nr:hypothetical protein [Aldersonia sp. NBC_00410]MCX5044074.1 hypothetical protein [Aldersonia sp. NBC_00410]